MKSVIKVKKDGKELELAVKSPSSEQRSEGQMIYAEHVTKALKKGLVSRDKLETYLREQGIWTDELEKKVQELSKKVSESVKKLKAGGLSVKDGHALALSIKDDRNHLVELRSKVTSWDNITAEAMGDNARFNYFVSACTVYNDTGEPYFKSLEDYENQATSDIAYESASALAALVAGVDPNFEESLPENKFLKRFGLEKVETVEEVVDEGDVSTAVFYDEEGKPV